MLNKIILVFAVLFVILIAPAGVYSQQPALPKIPVPDVPEEFEQRRTSIQEGYKIDEFDLKYLSDDFGESDFTPEEENELKQVYFRDDILKLKHLKIIRDKFALNSLDLIERNRKIQSKMAELTDKLDANTEIATQLKDQLVTLNAELDKIETLVNTFNIELEYKASLTKSDIEVEVSRLKTQATEIENSFRGLQLKQVTFLNTAENEQ